MSVVMKCLSDLVRRWHPPSDGTLCFCRWQAAMDFVVEEDLKAHLTCWYIQKYVKENPQPQYFEHIYQWPYMATARGEEEEEEDDDEAPWREIWLMHKKRTEATMGDWSHRGTPQCSWPADHGPQDSLSPDIGINQLPAVEARNQSWRTSGSTSSGCDVISGREGEFVIKHQNTGVTCEFVRFRRMRRVTLLSFSSVDWTGTDLASHGDDDFCTSPQAHFW